MASAPVVAGRAAYSRPRRQVFDAGDEVVAFLNTYGRGRVSGVELQPQVGHVLRFKDGKCIENVTYLDRAEALKAAGLR